MQLSRTHSRACTGGVACLFALGCEPHSIDVSVQTADADRPSACGAAASGTVESRTRFETASVPWDAACQSETQTRACEDGHWSSWTGTFIEEICVTLPPRSCGNTSHGSSESRSCFTSATVPYGSSCSSTQQTRTCDDGTWSPDFPSCAYLDCTEDPPASCGGTAHGNSESRSCYNAATVLYGSTCTYTTQTRICNNGTWSPDYPSCTYLTCAVVSDAVLVQQNVGGGEGILTLTVALPDETVVGDLLIMVGADRAAGISTVSGGGVPAGGWTLAARSTTNANVEIWYGVVGTASSTGVTITISVAGPTAMSVTEWRGLVADKDVVLDGSAATYGSAAVASVPSITTTHAKDLIIFAVGNGAPCTFGAPSQGPWSGPISAFSGTGIVEAFWYQVASSTGSFSPTVSVTAYGWDTAIAAFEVRP